MKLIGFKDNYPSGYTQFAIEAAKFSKIRFRVGCVLIRKSTVISVGWNKIRSVRSVTKRFIKFPGSIHAEVDAIINARADLRGCDAIVIRLDRMGKLALAKPCKDCLNYLEYVGIKTVYYSE